MKRFGVLLFLGAALLLTSNSVFAQYSPNVLPFAPASVSTVPSNGDGNPYGVAFVPASVPADGVLQPGDVLVANFNNAAGIQGTGSTIVRVSATGQVSLFFQTTVVGLTGALGILSNGIVIVGNLPTTDGTAATAGPGALTFIDRFGQQIGSLTGFGIHGPWGLAVSDPGKGQATVFVSQVLTGTVVRYTFSYNFTGTTIQLLTTNLIGGGYAHQPNAGAVVLGPSGLCYDAASDILLVASSNDNAIYAIAEASTRGLTSVPGTVIISDAAHLHGPLDLVMSPNGHVLVANSDGSNADPTQPSELVEFSQGKFVSEFSVDPNLGGAFGLAIFPISTGPLNVVRVAAVDDNTNSLDLWTSIVQ